MKFGNLELSIIRECTYKLDGGAMFGVVPKPLWSKTLPCDELNRVMLSCNLLLIESGNKRVLVETGMGDRWADKEKERYEIRTFLAPEQAVTPLGLSPDDIDAVIISHLHFDHVGGAVRLERGNLVPTYRKARYYIQRGEWEFAHNANARARGSYRPDDFEPLKEHGVLELIDGDTEIVSGVWARVTGGHTSHHQVVTWESNGQKGVFFADILPMRPHISPPWVMGYDHYPLESCDVKQQYLARAAKENWLLVFDHEPGVPWGHVQIKDGKFEFLPLPEDSLQYRKAAKISH